MFNINCRKRSLESLFFSLELYTDVWWWRYLSSPDLSARHPPWMQQLSDWISIHWRLQQLAKKSIVGCHPCAYLCNACLYIYCDAGHWLSLTVCWSVFSVCMHALFAPLLYACIPSQTLHACMHYYLYCMHDCIHAQRANRIDLMHPVRRKSQHIYWDKKIKNSIQVICEKIFLTLSFRVWTRSAWVIFANFWFCSVPACLGSLGTNKLYLSV